MNLDELKQIAVLQALDDAALTASRRCVGGARVCRRPDRLRRGRSGRRDVSSSAPARSASRRKPGLTLPAERPSRCWEPAITSARCRSSTRSRARRQPWPRDATRLLRLSQAAFDALPKEGSRVGMSVLFAMIRTSGERIRRLNAQVIVYDEIGKAIGESQSLEQLLDVVLHQLCRATLADWGMVAAARAVFRSRSKCAARSNLQLDRRATGRSGARQGTLARRSCADSREQLVRNLLKRNPSSRAPGWALRRRRCSLAADRDREPVARHDRPRRPAARPVRLNDLNLARGVARQTAQAILNARHREEEQARARHGRQFVRF